MAKGDDTDPNADQALPDDPESLYSPVKSGWSDPNMGGPTGYSPVNSTPMGDPTVTTQPYPMTPMTNADPVAPTTSPSSQPYPAVTSQPVPVTSSDPVPVQLTNTSYSNASSTGTQGWDGIRAPGHGVPGVFDFDNAGNAVDAYGHPYTGPLTGGSAGTSSPTASSSTYTPQGTPPTVSDPAQNASNTTFGNSMRDWLVKALNQGPVSVNDPEIAPAVLANRMATERGLQDQRSAIAERMNAQGLTGSGALDTAMQAAQERASSGEAQFSGNAVLDQAKARRQELVNLMQTGAGIMNADEARALQGKIADLDAYLREQSITNQNTQFYDQLGLSAAQWQALMNSGIFNSLGG